MVNQSKDAAALKMDLDLHASLAKSVGRLWTL